MNKNNGYVLFQVLVVCKILLILKEKNMLYYEMCMLYFKGKKINQVFPIEKNPRSILYIILKNILLIATKLERKKKEMNKGCFYIGTLYGDVSIDEKLNKKKTIFDDMINLPNELRNKAAMLAEWAKSYEAPLRDSERQ